MTRIAACDGPAGILATPRTARAADLDADCADGDQSSGGCLFEPLMLRGLAIRNRIGMAAMSQYSAVDSEVTDWHRVHYGARSIGTGLVMVEATSVSAEGTVTPHDLGLWDDRFVPGMRMLAGVIAERGAVPGVQLSHGGRKASRTRPWDGDVMLDPDSGGWPVVGPSPEPFAYGYVRPTALTLEGIERVVADFTAAACRAVAAGFRLIELHAGHGRLLHSFYSPVSNHRDDAYGGSFDNRVRLLLDVVNGVRQACPAEMPLAVRLSCVDWAPDGWTLDDSVRLAAMLREAGVDLIDCSSGGIRRPVTVPAAPGYQVPFASTIRRRAQVMTAAVGLITSGPQATGIIRDGHADMVLFGRAMLADPQLSLRIAVQFDPKAAGSLVPPQYERGLRSTGFCDRDETLRPLVGARPPQNLTHPSGFVFYNHAPAEQVRSVVGEDCWTGYFTFCFERNPWDKVISLYYHRYKVGPRPCLDEFIFGGEALDACNYPLYTIDGKLAVDHIGRYESLTADLAACAERVGLSTLPPMPRAKSQFRKDRRPPREVLTAEQQDHIASAFAVEIDLFGYEP